MLFSGRVPAPFCWLGVKKGTATPQTWDRLQHHPRCVGGASLTDFPKVTENKGRMEWKFRLCPWTPEATV